MRHLMGSRYFFGCYEDFESHDTDYVELVDVFIFEKDMRISGKGLDVIQMKRRSKSLIVQDALREGFPMAVGKFLIPEFCKEIGFTIEDLPRLRPLIDALDEKHTYERIIYEAYLENKDFVLTDAQRLEAYELYKNTRRKENGN